MLTIALCAVIAGAEGWTDTETFGKSKESWLKQFLKLENGIPSHDTFGDVLALLDGEAFQRCFIHWIEQVFTGKSLPLMGKQRVVATSKATKRALSTWYGLGQVRIG